MNQILKKYLVKETFSSPLVVFRIGFGMMMLFSIIRFWSKGWIEKLYINAQFHFTYYGFSWVKTLGGGTYLLFLICALAALCIALGYKYKLAVASFFLCFTYIELMDKTTYLNHYYFISILAFLMFFLPANCSFSLDAFRKKTNYTKVPKWTIDSIKILISLVYIYAGIAKINSDWLLQAMPLKIWLKSFYDLPIIGDNLLQQNWFHYAMSWGGMLYDISIPFLLFHKNTRTIGFAFVVFFHLFTWVLFPIGIFPYVMILCSIIFFSSQFHNRVLYLLRLISRKLSPKRAKHKFSNGSFIYKKPKLVQWIILCFFCIQIMNPFRYTLYSNELFWSEEGYRFSWRVMLMEKMGYTNFKIVNQDTGESFYVNNEDFLSAFQEKQMSFQPDFILEYAHYLGAYYTAQGIDNLAVYVESYVALNGRRSTQFIDPKVNLMEQEESFKNKNWVLPFTDDIKGF